MTAQAPAPASPVERAPSDTRLVSLDVLRGVAILLVLGVHLPRPDPSQAWYALWAVCYRIGWTGVDLFFVLSGFLVSGLLFRDYQRTGTLRVRRFLVRRGLKIYPSFWWFLACTAPIVAITTGAGWTALVPQLLFLQNYQPTLPGFWAPTWSLAIEEHFYLLLPLALALTLRRRGTVDRVPWIGAAVMLGALGGRVVHALLVPYALASHTMPTHLRLDSLAVGVLLSYAYHFHRTRTLAVAREHMGRLLAVAAACLALPLALPLKHPVMHTAGLSLLAVGYASVVLVTLVRPIQARPLAWLGTGSYAVYLWHAPVYVTLHALAVTHGAIPSGLLAAGDVVGSLAVGALMSRLIERPVLALRDRWFPA